MNGFNLVTANKITANDFVSELFALNFIANYCKFISCLNKNCASKFHNNFAIAL